MRVLHLGKFYPPARGGMETMLELICERTSTEVENRVLVASEKRGAGEERRRGVEVVRLPVIARVGAVAVCPTLPLRLRREQAEVIVIHEPNPMALLAYFISRPSGALLIWFHSEVVRPSWRYRLFYRPFLRFALARAARIIVASPTLAASAPELQDWQNKCGVIPYGIDPVREHPSEQIGRRVESIRTEQGRPIVLFVGRLVPYKGVDVLIEAMRGVAGVALLVGDGPERRPLEQRTRALGLCDRVKFLGSVGDDELSALYHACDLFVLPSVTRQEAFGVVQIEAMARGKPVISTDLATGVSFVNRHGETGLVVPPRDPDALRDAIRHLIENPERRAALGAAAARRTRALFSADRMIESTLSLYREVTGRDVGRKTVA
jgi:rhamnosyl/mannosyltransferase